MNLGLITPVEVVKELKEISKEVKINSLEGYFRQIAGWREFIKGVYQSYDEEFEKNNFFNHKRLMKKSWYNGSTGILPLDYSIKNASKFAWTHHIERLMIQANIMNLCEIKPFMLINGLWNIIWIHQSGLCIPMFMVWAYLVMEEYFQLNRTSVVHHILEK